MQRTNLGKELNQEARRIGWTIMFLVALFSTNGFAQRVTNTNHKGTKLITGNVVTESATAPTDPEPIQGDIWYDTTSHSTKVWDGTVWKPFISDGDLFWDTDRDTGIQVEETADDDTIRFDTAGTERMLIDPLGNVGIGTNPPTQKLDVDGWARVRVLDLIDNNELPSSNFNDLSPAPESWAGGVNPTITMNVADDIGGTTALRYESTTTVGARVVHFLTPGILGPYVISFWIRKTAGTATAFDARVSNLATQRWEVGIPITTDWQKISITERDGTNSVSGTMFALGLAGSGHSLSFEIYDAKIQSPLEVVVADKDGVLQKQSVTQLVKEPWFTVGTTTGHTSNYGNMFFSGRIGVGTNTLSTDKVATFAGDIKVTGVVDPTKLVFSDGTPSSFNPATNNQYEVEFQNGRDLNFKSNTRANILHLKNTGNVGIATNNPAYKLHVATGQALIDNLRIGNFINATWPGIAHTNTANTNSYALVQNSDGKTLVNAGTGQNIGFHINNLEKMRVHPDGNVGINNTAPTYKLDVGGTFRNTGAGFFTVMDGNDDMTTAPARGIRMWTSTADAYGIYMSQPGAGRSMAGNASISAVAGANFNEHAIRFRVLDNATKGFVFENSNEELLGSIRGSDGSVHFAGAYLDSDKDPGTAGQVLSTTGTATNWIDASTDDQKIDAFSFNSTTNILSLSLESDGEADKTVDLSGVVKEPWFTVGTTTGHTTNTGNMFFAGNIGVGTNTLSAGKVATFAGDVKVTGVLDPTKLVFSDGTPSSFNPTTNNQYEVEFGNGRHLNFKSNTTSNILHLKNTGNVGIATNDPTYKLDVGGSFRNTGPGLFSVMGGNDDMTATPARGIRMWTSTATTWGIYMSQSGAAHAMDGGTAPSGTSFDSYAIRFRATSNNGNSGFIFENAANNTEVMSIRAGDGLIHSKYIQDNFNRTNLNGSLMVASANGFITGTTDFYRVTSPGVIEQTPIDLGNIYNYASIKGYLYGIQCVSMLTNSFHLEYTPQTGFTLVRSAGAGAGGSWVFAGTGTVSDPYTATSPRLVGSSCVNNKEEYIVFSIDTTNKKLMVTSTPSTYNSVAERVLIETY